MTDLKKGKIEFKLDKNANINSIVGKLSFEKHALIENINMFVHAINKARPAAAKGIFMKSLYLSSTMGPGINLNIQSIITS